MPTSTYLGIDFGTSGVRACLIDSDSNIITEQRHPLPSPYRNGNQVTQHPRIWWEALQQLLDELCQHDACKNLRAIAIDGTASTVLLTDAAGEPLADALMYNDSSAIEYVAAIQQAAPKDHVCCSATSSLAKTLYLRDQVNTDSIAHILHQSDWILGKLSGHYDISDENNTLKLGYDPAQRLWPNWVNSLVSLDWLPTVYPAGTTVATIAQPWVQRWQLPADTQLVTGTTDSTASVIATGINNPAQAVTVLGSTLVLKVLTDSPVADARFGVYSHRLGNLWLAGGASNSGGAVLKQLFTQQQLDEMTPQLNPDQLTGLDFYPLPASGERFPINDPKLAPRMTPRPANDVHYFQGLLESMAAIERQGYQLLQSLGAPYPEEVLTAGGGAQNSAWRQIRQQLLGIPVKIATHQEAAYGSALLALQGMTA